MKTFFDRISELTKWLKGRAALLLILFILQFCLSVQAAPIHFWNYTDPNRTGIDKVNSNTMASAWLTWSTNWVGSNQLQAADKFIGFSSPGLTNGIFLITASNLAVQLGQWITNAGGGGGSGDVTTAQLNNASNVLRSLTIANDTTTSNGLTAIFVANDTTTSNALRTLLIANDTTTSNGLVTLVSGNITTTSNGLVAFTMTASNTLRGAFIANVSGLASNLYVSTAGAGTVPLNVKGASGQGQNLLEVRNSSDVVLFQVASNGVLVGTGGAGPRLLHTSTAGYVWTATGTDGTGGWSPITGGGDVTTAQLNTASNTVRGASIANSSGRGTNTTLYGSIQLGDGDSGGTTTTSNNLSIKASATLQSGSTLSFQDGTANRVLYLTAGKVMGTSANVDPTELGYLDGVTGGIQTNVDARLPNNGGLGTNETFYGLTLPTLTASRALVLNASGNPTNASGTPDGTKFLRDDNTYAVPAAGGTVAWRTNNTAAGSENVANFTNNLEFLWVVNDVGASTRVDIEARLQTAGVAFSKIQNISSDRVLGRDTPGSGAIEELTLDPTLEFTGSSAIRRAALTGDVTSPAGSGVTTIANDAVTDAKLRNSAGVSLIGRAGNSTGDPADILLVNNGEWLWRSNNAVISGKGILTNSSFMNVSVANVADGDLLTYHNSAGLITNRPPTSNYVALNVGSLLSSNVTSLISTNLDTNAAVTFDMTGPAIGHYGIYGNSTISLTNMVAFTNSAGSRSVILKIRQVGVSGTLTIAPIGPHAIDWDDGAPFIATGATNTLVIEWDGRQLLGSSSHMAKTGAGALVLSNAPSLYAPNIVNATASRVLMKAADGTATNVTSSSPSTEFVRPDGTTASVPSGGLVVSLSVGTSTNVVIDLGYASTNRVDFKVAVLTNCHVVFSNATLMANPATIKWQIDTNGVRSILSLRSTDGLIATNGNLSFTTNANALDVWDLTGGYFTSNVVVTAGNADTIMALSVTSAAIYAQAGGSSSNVAVGGVLYKAVTTTAFTNLNATIATFTNAGQYIVPAHTLTNSGDSHLTVWRGNMLAGSNDLKIVYGYQTVLDTGAFTNATTAWEAGLEVTRTGNVGGHADAWVKFVQVAGTLTADNLSGFRANLELSCTNGTAITNVLQMSSSRTGAVSNNFMRVTWEPASQ